MGGPGGQSPGRLLWVQVSWVSLLGRGSSNGARAMFRVGLLGGLLPVSLCPLLAPHERQVLLFGPPFCSRSPKHWLPRSEPLGSGCKLCPLHVPPKVPLCFGHWAGLGIGAWGHALPTGSQYTVWWEAEEATGSCSQGERSTKERGLPRLGRTSRKSGTSRLT